MLPCLHGGLCKPGFVAVEDTVTCLFFGWTLSDISSQQKAATEHGGEGTHTAALSSPVCRELSLPLYMYILLATVASGLCHLSVLLVLRSLEPVERRGPLCPALQNFMLHQTSKDCSDMLAGDPWWNETSPVRNHWT